jgi:NB-ARC domain
VVRLTAAALIAAIEDDRERHRYRLVHSLVRADGIGEWSRAIDDTLTGPASQHIVPSARDDRRVLTERVGPESWQYTAVGQLAEVLRCIDSNYPGVASRLALRSWFTSFAELRNKTRGHGAPTSALCSRVCPQLEQSIELLCSHIPFFERSWAYLHRNLSGKYRVLEVGGDPSPFTHLKTSDAINLQPYPNGVYMYLDIPRRVELLYSNVDLSDFFFPNGAFNGKRFELHSLITDDRLEGDASAYLATASDYPPSETQGIGQLDAVGSVWSNLPAAPADYVRRSALETEIIDALMNDRHPIVTLVGRGGIGKTSLALQTLHYVAFTDRYDAILWFSARDMDLLPSGPRNVKAQVLTEKDISNEFATLLGPYAAVAPGKTALDMMAYSLRSSCLGGPMLFVFDNFETVRSPVDVFHWLDANIRLPNKIMITSRFRDFKADYPITITGMEQAEANELISRTAKSLSIDGILTSDFKEKLRDDSDGHPYVIKIVLGEVANTKNLGKPERLISRKDDVLDALFERTFANLSPLASRIFLTLSGWRSLVPQLALEAVLLRDQSERIDPAAAIDELVRMSFVQRTTAQDGTDFLDTPLAAAIFGSRKLSVSPIKILIENDIRLLQDLGPTSVRSLSEGFQPKVQRLFRRIATRILDGKVAMPAMRPVLEFIAQNYPPAWLLLADLEEEVEERGSNIAAEYVRRYLEREPDGPYSRDAWERLANLYRKGGNVVAACGAFARAFDGPGAPLGEISSMANWLNNNAAAIERMETTDRASIFGALAALMERRMGEASATDLSRLAWLYLHADNGRRALEIAEMGLERDPGNLHCQRLVERLALQY